MSIEIDFVIPYCNSNDREWNDKKNHYLNINNRANKDNSANRYRDWDNLRYWFRGAEKFAPWVNKIHFITDHQIPDWLNTNHPKLNCVFHEDYIDKKYLPVFSANPIELGLHRINGLSDYFVYFNDDLFLTDYVNESDFFVNNKPCDFAGLVINNADTSLGKMQANNLKIINKYFNYKYVLSKNFTKFFNPLLGKDFIRTVLRLRGKEFKGFNIPHLSTSYRKSDYERVWDKEPEILESVYNNRFRSNDDLNHFIFRYWRLCVGDYKTKKLKGRYFNLETVKDAKIIANAIKKQKYKEICINDNFSEENTDTVIETINKAFEEILSEKSLFEK